MVDSAKIIIKAGNGGNGVVHFRRERFIPKGGPDGGDGGKGGSVYVVSDANLATLDHFAFRQRFEAKNGRSGGEKRSTGASADDLYLKVPVGTVVKLTKVSGSELSESSEPGWEKVIDFDRPGMEVLIAKGGKGGRGNWHFKSSTNTTPMEAESGKPGERWRAELDLLILADVGLIGLPNVGKSTLLSILSAARPKIANYPFTTLEPNLGVMTSRSGKGSEPSGGSESGSMVIADIPGLVEGASGGKGLGTQFLRHIERSRVLAHVLAGDEAEQLYRDYQTVRNELKQYGGGAEEKKELVVLNKIDLLAEEKVAEIVGFFAKKKIRVLAVSGGNLSGIELLRKKLVQFVVGGPGGN